MNMRKTIITSLLLGAFAFFSLGLSGYFGNWSNWMYQYMPKRETIMSYADPRAYSWKTYAALLATGIGATAAWKYYQQYQQQQKMKNQQTEDQRNNRLYVAHINSEIDTLTNVNGEDLSQKHNAILHRITQMSLVDLKDPINKNENINISTLKNAVAEAKKDIISGLLLIFDGNPATERERLGKLSLSALVKEYDQKNDDILKKKIELQKQSEEK